MSVLARVVEAVRTRNLDGLVSNAIAAGRGRPRRLYRHPRPSQEAWSARRLNAIAEQCPAMTDYLGSACSRAPRSRQVKVARKVAVDPAPRFDLNHLPPEVTVLATTSDAFFSALSDEARFDQYCRDGSAMGFEHEPYRAPRECAVPALSPAGRHPLWTTWCRTARPLAIRSQSESYDRRRADGDPRWSWHRDVLSGWSRALRSTTRSAGIRNDRGPRQSATARMDPGPGAKVHAGDEVALAQCAELSYTDVFDQGLPQSFARGSE